MFIYSLDPQDYDQHGKSEEEVNPPAAAKCR